MDKLFNGTIRFKETSFQKNKELFESLGRGQAPPHTLFIAAPIPESSPPDS